MGVPELQDGAVLGVSWPLPSGQLPFPLSSNTSGFSCHTPVADVIKWVWYDLFYLMEAFYVV